MSWYHRSRSLAVALTGRHSEWHAGHASIARRSCAASRGGDGCARLTKLHLRPFADVGMERESAFDSRRLIMTTEPEDAYLVPFVLRQRTPLPSASAPGLNDAYDTNLQLWLSSESGRPLVLDEITRRALAAEAQSANTAHAELTASNFGETILTKTSEGTDQSEGTRHASSFGETIHTATSEGVDQSEVTA